MSADKGFVPEAEQAPGADAEVAPSFNPEDLTRWERSSLLYFETCAVDGGGLCEGVRMNASDYDAAAKFMAAGLLEFRRVPHALIYRGFTHIVRLHDGGWSLAHMLRMKRATQLGPRATAVWADIEAAALRPASAPDRSSGDDL